MILFTTDTLCSLTGAHPANLRRWHRSGLLSLQLPGDVWDNRHMNQVQGILAATAMGVSPKELAISIERGLPLITRGWSARRGEVLFELAYGTTRSLSRIVRNLASDFSGDDFINHLMRPLSFWLMQELRKSSSYRCQRFHDSIRFYAETTYRASKRNNSIPLYLEAVSTRDRNEIWLEAIRLTAQGFCVEVCSGTNMGQLPAEHHQHHLMWCGAGISSSRMSQYLDERESGYPVMLCGPDQSILKDSVACMVPL
ncbi:hypothetical protein L579_1001 [Pantoea sp. AS-PWVM4]|uniref:hypothetical protein n=1 Tax=Pantoea sp. AS-PWVM4 TaxID=1332069 RepID=UPI0003AC752A|nr:hypothetical protein [Pantoea sp. AS-PWVM4]ERK11200.1 hypothetical protein L579_1001 [Pantoea sp. AS-PWVM4]